MKKAILVLASLLFLIGMEQRAEAQGNLPVFSWRSHFSYRNIVDISQSTDRVYAATTNALFYVDKQELSIQKITKVDGLSEVGIGAIGIAPNSNTLVIGYSSGNIDILNDNSITNIRDFLDASLIGDKTIRGISFNAGKAYLACDQGILVIDMEARQIVESYQNLSPNGTRIPIFGVSFTADSIFAASEGGILSASLSATVNRQDFSNWNRNLTSLSFSRIEGNGSQLVASSSNQIYAYANNRWTLENTLGDLITDLQFASDLLVLTSSGLNRIANGSITSLLDLEDSQGTANALSADGGSFWVGDGLNGLRRFTGTEPESFSPSGPASDENWAMTTDDSDVLLVHGGHSDMLSTLGRLGELSRFNPESGWQSEAISLGFNDDLFDLVDLIVPSTENENLYLASFDRGLVSVNAEELVTVVNESSSNSSLISTGGSVNMTAIEADANGIWMCNYGSNRPLHFWDPATDTWTGYNLSSSLADFPIDLYIAPNGDKWMPIDHDRGGGIVVFNETTERERYLNNNGGQGGLPGRNVTSLALDQDFFLWVGTDDGIAFYPNLNAILEGTALTASVPIFENRLLLRDEFITSIAIDPGNRKWFGTRNNGLWLFSATGEEQVRHFTEDNSPLPSNNITNLRIELRSGELFIGTDKGTVSFRSDATQGTSQHEEVAIYPNPAMRNSINQIVISGLVNNAQVKITDVSGKLVKELRAQGSTALWNGRDINGIVVATGVYLVYSSNADGTETFVGKIAVI